MVDAYYAVRAYDVQRGIPPFEEFVHAPIIRGSRPFKIKIPSIFLPWDDTRGILAIRRRNKILATCRCGVVLSGIYFQHQNPTHQISIALKVMDREQVILQKDDVEGEVRAMAQLQNGGITAALNNRFVLRWEYGEDQYNQYLATEYVANGSLISYASKVIRALVAKHYDAFNKKQKRIPSNLEAIAYVYRAAGNEWMRHGLQLFSDIVEGLTYLHAQNIAHLDFDIYNIAIDRELRARVIDFGSSQLMDHRGFVAAGDVDIKAKFLFVAPEVRKHSRLRVPRPGFDGARADLWSAGVVLVQCIVWAFQGGEFYLRTRPQWRTEVFRHIDGLCDPNPEKCYFCKNFILIPPLIGNIVKSLLQQDPKLRPTAYQVTMALKAVTSCATSTARAARFA